jgi:hypothetical protein
MLRAVFLRDWKAAYGVEWGPRSGWLLLLGSSAAVREKLDTVVNCVVDAEPGSPVLCVADDLSAVMAAGDLVSVAGDTFQVVSVGPSLSSVAEHTVVRQGDYKVKVMGQNLAADIKPGDAVRLGTTLCRVASVTDPQAKASKKKKGGAAAAAGAAAPSMVVRALNPNTPGCIIELVDPYTGDEANPQLMYAGAGQGSGCTITLSAPYTGVDSHPSVLYAGVRSARPWPPLVQLDGKGVDKDTRQLLLVGDVGSWDTTMLFKVLMGLEASPWAPGRVGGPPETVAEVMRQTITAIKNTRNGVCHVSSSRVVTIQKLSECIASCDAFIAGAFPDPADCAQWTARRRELSENHGAFDGALLDSYALELRREAVLERLRDLREGIADNLKRQNGVALADAFRSSAARHRKRRADGTREW